MQLSEVRGALRRSPNMIIKRAKFVELILTLSILAGCNSDKVTSPIVTYPQPTLVDVAYCPGSAPDWVAFQDGNGAWAQAQPTLVGNHVTFRHTFTNDRGAIATAREFEGSLTTLDVEYGAPNELATVGDTNPVHCGPPVSKTLLGTVSGLGTNDVVNVNAGFGTRDFAFPAQGNSFSLPGLASGPQDILATLVTQANGANVLSRIILRRSPEQPDSATLPVLDFGSSEAFAPAVANVTIAGLGPEGAQLLTQLSTPYSKNQISFLTSSAFAATRTFYAVPQARLREGDMQVMNVTASPTVSNIIRSAAVYFRSPVDQTLTLGAPATVPALSLVSTTPSLRLRAIFDRQQDYDRLTAITYQQGLNTVVSVAMTSTYADLTATGYELIMPDLSGAQGFDPRWALRPGTAVSWIASRIGGTLGLGSNAAPTDGATVRNGEVFGTFDP